MTPKQKPGFNFKEMIEFTVDGQTKEDNTVTVRERDSMEQIRLAADKLLSHLREKLGL